MAFQQSCTTRVHLNYTEVIIVTFFHNSKSCTSKLNLNSYTWYKVEDIDVNIPIGGHLATSIDKHEVYYLGGLYKTHLKEVQSLDAYKLGPKGWQLKEAKLPFGISSNETKSYPSLHNVTLI